MRHRFQLEAPSYSLFSNFLCSKTLERLAFHRAFPFTDEYHQPRMSVIYLALQCGRVWLLVVMKGKGPALLITLSLGMESQLMRKKWS